MSGSERPSIDEDTFVLVLTGAGVSAESGIPTFRGAGGLWENRRFEELASPEGFAADPAQVWKFYAWRREVAEGCQTNPGHHALAALERRLGDRFLLVTQNVDGFHRAAGNERVLELHGNLFTSRCADCSRPPFEDRSRPTNGAPVCDLCGGRIRPHIVWFGESLNHAHFAEMEAFLGRAVGHPLVFLAAGTSGAVFPAAGLVEVARRAGADTWLVNAEPADNGHLFHHFVQGRSGEILPKLFG